VTINDIVDLWPVIVRKRSCKDNRLAGAGPLDLCQKVRLLLNEMGVNQDDIHIRESAKQVKAAREVICRKHIVFCGFHYEFARGESFRLLFF